MFGGYDAGPGIVVGHGGDHHHPIAAAPDFHPLDPLGMDVVHDHRPDPAGGVMPFIFGD